MLGWALALLCTAGAASDAGSETETFRGTFGDVAVRVRLERSGAEVTGVYRLDGSVQNLTLRGAVKHSSDPEVFDVLELTGRDGARVTGTFRALLPASLRELQGARWKPLGAQKDVEVKLTPDSFYPEPVELRGGLKLAPQEASMRGNRCSASALYPKLLGAVDTARQSKLDAQWKHDWGSVACDSAQGSEPDYESSSSYRVLTRKPGRFVGLRFDAYSFSGGAHGNTMSSCYVLDLDTLSLFRLGDALTDPGRAQLGEKVTRLLEKQAGRKLDPDDGFLVDHVVVSKGEDLCLEDDEIAVDFRDYELTTHAEGPPYVRLPRAAFADWLARSPQLDALFGRTQ